MTNTEFKPNILVATAAASMLFSALSPAYAAIPLPDASLDGIESAGEIAPVDLRDRDGNGLADGLQEQLAGLRVNELVDVVVTLDHPASAARIEQLIGAFDLGHEFTLINAFSGTVTVGQARALARIPFVSRVEPVYQVSAAAEGTRGDAGVDGIYATPGVSSTGTGAGIGFCTVDSGIMTTHEMFDAPGKIAGTCDAIGAESRANTCAVGGTIEDDVGHGTSVAAIAAGDGTGSPYAVALRGMAPGAKLYIAKALRSDGIFGFAVGSDVDVQLAVEWCAGQAGARTINLSIQGDQAQSDGLDAMSLIVDAAVGAGKVVIAGAGNNDAPHTIQPPAAAHLAIVVGAYGEWSGAPDFIAAADLLDQQRGDGLTVEGDTARAALSDGPFPALFSTRGTADVNRTKPDIMAPGHTIATAAADPGFVVNCGNQCYDVVSGTSFSTPVVSGIVALMLEADPSLTPDEVRAILFDTARDRGYMGLDGNGQETVPLKGTDWGFGIVDAHSAVAIAREGTGDTTLNSALAAPMPAKHSKGREWVTEDLNGDRFEEVLIDFTVTSADAVSGVPLAISVSSPLSGFLTTIPNCPPILCGYRYVPDIDIFLYRRANGNNYTQIASSICPAAAYNGECGPNGVHESIRIANPAADDYRLGIVFLNDEIDSSASNALVKYDITWGATTTTPTAPVANLAPIPEPIADFTSNLTSVSLDASASSDPDGSIAFYAWYSASDTEAGTSPQATLELPNGQTTVVTLTVTDNLGKSASHDIAVTVATGGPVNQAPTAGPQNVSTDEDTALPITLTGSDPEGDPLTFTLVAQPANGRGMSRVMLKS